MSRWKCQLLSFCTKIHVTRGPCFFLCCAWFSRSIHWSFFFELWEFQLVFFHEFCPSPNFDPGFSWDIVLMEEILHHLWCTRPCKLLEFHHINWCRISSINSSETRGVVVSYPSQHQCATFVARPHSLWTLLTRRTLDPWNGWRLGDLEWTHPDMAVNGNKYRKQTSPPLWKSWGPCWIFDVCIKASKSSMFDAKVGKAAVLEFLFFETKTIKSIRNEDATSCRWFNQLLWCYC